MGDDTAYMDLQSRAQKAFQDGDYAAALRLTTKLLTLELNPAERAHLLCEVGELHALTGDPERAAGAFRECLEAVSAAPEDAGLLYATAKSHVYLYRLSGSRTHADWALEYLQNLVSNYPGSPFLYSGLAYLAEVALSVDAFDLAEDAYRRAESAAANDIDRGFAQLGRSAVYIRTSRLSAAKAICEQLRRAETSTAAVLARAHFMLGDIAELEGEPTRAVAEWEQSRTFQASDTTLEKDAEHTADLLSRLGRAYYDLGQYSAASSMLRTLLDLVTEGHPYYVDSHITLGHIAGSEREWARARAHYERALSASEATEAQTQAIIAGLTRIGEVESH